MARKAGTFEIGQTIAFAFETIGSRFVGVALLIVGVTALNVVADLYGRGWDWPINIISNLILTVITTYFALKIRCGEDIAIKLPFGRALIATILMTLGMTLGFFFLFIPGLYLLVGWSFAIPALMAENTTAPGSLSRSWVLTDNCRWPLLGMILMVRIPFLIFVIWGGTLAETFFGPTVQEALPFVLMSGAVSVIGEFFVNVLLSEAYITVSGHREQLSTLQHIFA